MNKLTEFLKRNGMNFEFTVTSSPSVLMFCSNFGKQIGLIPSFDKGGNSRGSLRTKRATANYQSYKKLKDKSAEIFPMIN